MGRKKVVISGGTVTGKIARVGGSISRGGRGRRDVGRCGGGSG